ncbi:hypothetical protein [Azospirillum canadense]|uniref:hypothetical protein n=1 Tax=Azospirillum canadense TaxID=403962 RepID=UPI0022278A40|nr:hypothetical protein [Azospirillum canadense]MCW2243158.1 hypothetical protein [Azospirillum canadense]
MNDPHAREFHLALARHDDALQRAERALADGGDHARRRQAGGVRMSDALVADLQRWTARFRTLHRRLIGLRLELEAERVTARRVAPRVLWGRSAVTMRMAIVGMWLWINIVAVLVVSGLVGASVAGYVYRRELAEAALLVLALVAGAVRQLFEGLL